MTPSFAGFGLLCIPNGYSMSKTRKLYQHPFTLCQLFPVSSFICRPRLYQKWIVIVIDKRDLTLSFFLGGGVIVMKWLEIVFNKELYLKYSLSSKLRILILFASGFLKQIV